MVADSRLAGREFGDLEERKKGLVRENRPGFQMNVANQKEGCPAKRDGIQKKFCFFGHFGSDNFGNESTLQAILYHLRQVFPDAKFACICSRPATLAATQNIQAFPISGMVVKAWTRRGRVVALLRKVLVGVPSELYRWLIAFNTLRGTCVLIIPGTGLLTDAYGLHGWGPGPYNLYKWVWMAKLRRCKVFFVSVGAGPIYGGLGRYLVKSALSLADFRSYRDQSSLDCVKAIGLPSNDDRVYPDLVFGLPKASLPRDANTKGAKCVVALGLMEYTGRYSVEKPSNATYPAYLENLVIFVKWLLSNEYDVRLLSGDRGDRVVLQEFVALAKVRLGTYDQKRIINEPLFSVEELLSQLAATDIVVATRFHNILLALLLNKPVISLSFHHKCASLMEEMGLSKYCHDINHMNADRLIKQFQDLKRNAERLKPLIRQRVEQSRKALDEQYSVIFNRL